MRMRRAIAAPGDAPISELNTTPLIDVMLVLLIMFILTIPSTSHEVPLDLPQPSTAHRSRRPGCRRGSGPSPPIPARSSTSSPTAKPLMSVSTRCWLRCTGPGSPVSAWTITASQVR